VVEAFYTPCVRFGRDKQGNQTSYPPNLKVQLRRKRDGSDFECLFYDQKSKGDPDAQPLRGIPAEELLVKRSELTALIECTGVWFAGGKFGVSWKAVQIRLDSVPSGLRGYGFEEEEGEEVVAEADEEEAAPAPVKSAPAKQAPAPASAVAEEEDEAEESGEEIAPPPMPKKTATVTKKKVVAAAVTKK
jgi:hypothetical protein